MLLAALVEAADQHAAALLQLLADHGAGQQLADVRAALREGLQHQRAQQRQGLQTGHRHVGVRRLLAAGQQHALPDALPGGGALLREEEGGRLEQLHAGHRELGRGGLARDALREVVQLREHRQDGLHADGGELRLSPASGRHAQRREQARLDGEENGEAMRHLDVGAPAGVVH